MKDKKLRKALEEAGILKKMPYGIYPFTTQSEGKFPYWVKDFSEEKEMINAKLNQIEKKLNLLITHLIKQ